MQPSLSPIVPDMFPGLELQEDERVLFSGYSTTGLHNPLQPGRKHHEGFVLTNRRLIMLARPRSGELAGTKVSNLTSMPLSRIDGIQAVDVRWSFFSVLAFLVLCLLYIIPGLLFLVYMSSRTGLWLRVSSGSCANELKLARSAAGNVSELSTLVNAYADAPRCAEAGHSSYAAPVDERTGAAVGESSLRSAFHTTRV